MELVDSHCHLDGDRFDADRPAVIARARAAGVSTLVAIGTGNGPPDLEAGLRLAREFAGVQATVGIQPHDAGKAGPADFERLAALAREPEVAACGEIGLDYHYRFFPPEVQRAVFVRQLEIAREAGLPVVIHTREAWADTVRLLREHFPGERLGGVFHCFSEGPRQAAEAVELGFHVSFSGILTFPAAEEIRAAAKEVPADRLLIETDAPYLAPVPHRGHRNEPAFLVHTAERLAALRGLALEQLAALTTANWRRLCLRHSGQTR